MQGNNSSRNQIVKRTSDFAAGGRGGGNVVETAEVWNAQFSSAPNHGDIFAVGPVAYRLVSAGATGFSSADNFMYVAYNTDVSTAASAFSAAINLATNIDGFNTTFTNGGATAVTAAGSTTDITVTAALAGNAIPVDNTKTPGGVSGVVFTQTTQNAGGLPLGEGFLSYRTSAGNLLRVKDPAELTRLQVQFPNQKS